MRVNEDDLRGELSSLVGSARALLEQLRDSGAEEVESSGPPARRKRARLEAQRSAPAERPRMAPPGSAPASTLASTSVHAASPEPRHEAALAARPTRSGKLPPDAGQLADKRPGRPAGGSGAPSLDPIAKRVRLEQIERAVVECKRCVLHETRTKTVFARGDAGAELMFVGEGPGADEDAQGIPFVGKAGQLLDKMIEAMGYAPADVYIANIVKCRPPGNRKPEPGEMEACEAYLHEQIALIQPKVIVALGATAVEGLLKISGITKLRGTWRLYRGEIPTMPTFHPAYLLRNPAAKREVWSDLKQVMKRLGKEPRQ